LNLQAIFHPAASDGESATPLGMRARRPGNGPDRPSQA